jgi:hypothetical protein
VTGNEVWRQLGINTQSIWHHHHRNWSEYGASFDWSRHILFLIIIYPIHFSPFLIKKNKSKWNVTYSHRSDRWIFCRATLKSVEGKKKNIWTSSVRVCDGKENLWRDPAAHFCLGIDLTVASRTKYGRVGPLSLLVRPERTAPTCFRHTHPTCNYSRRLWNRIEQQQQQQLWEIHGSRLTAIFSLSFF